ncbi:efflux RND transporter periplasmic adaptor subunit [Paenibacillus herberti]|uniref:efflux RND transporter periplasmic adaptor subunit n=1 Tax=Paenibacillus herberti TaxID=1619309 RepID=UPI00159605C6|nr:efflux RND transporter periplasmic adaptor subunit [Paenibacillus herberti]
MRKGILVLGILILVVGGYGYYAYRSQDDAPIAAAAIARTVTVTQGKIEVKVSGTGAVAAVEQSVLKAGRQGTVAKVLVSAGDEVAAGQTLVTFEKTDQSFSIRQKELEQDKQELQLQQLKKQYWQEGDADKQSEIMLQIDSVKLTMEQLEEEGANLQREQSAKNDLIADTAGTVTAVSVAAGQEVNANAEAVSITDYSKLSFTMNADELDVPKLKVGQPAIISLNALTERTFEGKISEIAREGVSSNGVATYPVSVTLSDLEGVLVGMSGSAEIITDSAENAVLVPVDAVVTLGGKSYVRVPTSGIGDGGADANAEGGGQDVATGNAPQAAGGGEAGTGGQRSGAGRDAGGAASAGTQRSGVNGTDADNARANRLALGGQLQEVEVGLVSEEFAQIVSGLEAGASVLVALPTGTVGGSSAQSGQMQRIQGGFGGSFGGGGFGGGMPAGSFPGGGAGGGTGGGAAGGRN